MLKTSLRRWRVELFLKRADAFKALPFFQDTVCKNTTVRAFEALREYRDRQHQKRARYQRGHDFYRFSLEQRAFETLRWYFEVQSERRNKVEFLKALRHDRVKTKVIEILTNHLKRKQQLRGIAKKVARTQERRLVWRHMEMWAKQYYKITVKQPSKEFLDRFYCRTLQ